MFLGSQPQLLDTLLKILSQTDVDNYPPYELRKSVNFFFDLELEWRMDAFTYHKILPSIVLNELGFDFS